MGFADNFPMIYDFVKAEEWHEERKDEIVNEYKNKIKINSIMDISELAIPEIRKFNILVNRASEVIIRFKEYDDTHLTDLLNEFNKPFLKREEVVTKKGLFSKKVEIVEPTGIVEVDFKKFLETPKDELVYKIEKLYIELMRYKAQSEKNFNEILIVNDGLIGTFKILLEHIYFLKSIDNEEFEKFIFDKIQNIKNCIRNATMVMGQVYDSLKVITHTCNLLDKNFLITIPNLKNLVVMSNDYFKEQTKIESEKSFFYSETEYLKNQNESEEIKKCLSVLAKSMENSPQKIRDELPF